MYICECGALPSDIVVSGNTITGNSASDGGGIYTASLFGATISDNTLTANHDSAHEGFVMTPLTTQAVLTMR